MSTTTNEKISSQQRERQFLALERERLKTDLVTEASERLNGAMENVFEYDYYDNDFYFQGQALRPIFLRGIRTAEEIVRHQPQFAVELLRRHIELRQLEEQINLMQNVDQQNPLVLVHISPTPDAVLGGEVDLNAYDKSRQTIMIRITEPTVDGAKVTSLSLDGGDRLALQAIGDFFGVDIPDDATSEDILAMRFLAEKSQFSDERPAKVIRQLYDRAMQLQYGGEWHAGRQDSDVTTTIQKINRYPGLVEQITDEVWQIKQRHGKDFRFTQDYDRAMYNFLASIEASERAGAAVADMSGAGEAARQAGTKYSDSSCPTGRPQTAEQALELQGILQGLEWHYGTCRVCLHSGMVGACEVCSSCEKADNRGESLDLIHQRALARVALAANTSLPSQPNEEKRKMNTNLNVEAIYGADAVIESRIAVADEVFQVVNRRTGEIILKSLAKSDFALAV